ncbi:HAD-IA family hydrolase [Ulvibacterium sp.]|uniref:HAD-IA family hydrolase n=1 Tax=Ulvibacterium sp. TaxID=2665914 RepID=UPI003BA93037
MKYKCIIFDCDGVLVDSELITAKVLVAMGKDLGLHIDLDFVVGEFLGKSLNDIMHYLNMLTKGQLPPDFESEYRKKTYEAFKNELKPIAGIHSVIENLEVPFCVASSGPLEKIRANLTTTGLIDKFEGRIFSCYEIQRWKPNPHIFLHAAKSMGFRPEECAVVEDSKVGVQAALAGGFDVFVYSKNGHDYPIDPQEAFVFQDMGELGMLLSRS